MVRLQPIEVQEFREERTCRKPQSPLHVRVEHDELAILGLRRGLSCRGGAGFHIARRPQKPIPADLPEECFIYGGAHPRTRTRHGGSISHCGRSRCKDGKNQRRSRQERGSARTSEEDEAGVGNRNSGRSPSFPFLKQGRRNCSAHRATWGASMPHRPQTIPRTGSCHKESSPSKPRRRAPDIGQSSIITTRRQDVADASHDSRLPRRQVYRRPATPSRTSRLRLPPFYSANFKPDDLDYSNATKIEKLEKFSQQAGKTPRSRGLVLGI